MPRCIPLVQGVEEIGIGGFYVEKRPDALPVISKRMRIDMNRVASELFFSYGDLLGYKIH